MMKILWMAILSENLQDEVCRNTKILCDCNDTKSTYATRTTLMQFSNFLAVLIVTLFLKRTFNLKQHFSTCSQRMKKVYPKNVHQSRETLFDKLDFFGIGYTNEQTLVKNLAIFDFESICVQE